MKNYYLSVLMLLFAAGVFAQHAHHDETGMQCSHSKFLIDYFKASKDIIQTPLLHDYDVTFYFLDLNVENNTIDISGNVTIEANVLVNELDTFAFELLDELTIDSVLINGMSSPFNHINNEVFVIPANSLSNGEHFSAQIFYGGTPPTGGFFSGISTAYSSQWQKDVTWTLSEPFNARQWWPCKQVLPDKADSVWVFLTTNENNLAGSIGLLTSTTPVAGGKVRFEWKSRYPINYYLISFAVAEYQDYSIYAKPAAMQGDSILIQNYIYNTAGCLQNYQSGIDQTAEFVELFSDLYTLYPFYEEKYGHCLAQIGGGMEHQTMTTIGSFNFGLVAHELGHMWFGDNVTCATWSDIWINEGFATYTDYLANEMILGDSAAQQYMQNVHNNVMSQPGGSTYIPPEEITYENVWRIFDGRLSYRKGAAIIHMIRFELQDDDMFFQVLQDFQVQYADSVATGLDFMNVLNAVSGMDFTDFFDQWYFGEGYPTYDIVWYQDNENFNFSSVQSTSSSTSLFKMLMAYKLNLDDGTDTTVYVYQNENVSNYSIPVSKTITNIFVDPDNWVINKVGSITVGVEETDHPAYFTFGPNPAEKELTVFTPNTNGQTKEILLLDLNGKMVDRIATDGENVKIDVSDLQPSVYFNKLINGNSVKVKKFLKS
ncbi:MAG: T9SS type A sorting domain-containing protein [Bacteroidales bacterium]|nr:T9SS type A sorting domain-containing protein [Bacteroidales bacterium]